nr:ribonuclease H-like domain-containing protein [Tanacetum cinerariifolium]
MEGVLTEMPITTAEERAQRRLKVKVRSTLMMGIPNEHQLKFNSIKDAKKFMEAVKKRFDGNEATRKTQRNLLKQQYENFTAPSLEILYQTFDRLQKLVRNKADLDSMSMDDLYNNLKVYEPEFKGMSSLSSSTWNMAFVSYSNNNTSRTNEAVNTAHRVSTASTQVNVAYSINIDNLSNSVICAFFASQPNSPQHVHEDLKQIHPDDMEEMDLRWQMAMLTMKARRFLNNIGRKFTVNGNETISFDKSKVECYNCHKRGHFAREHRALRNQDNKNKERSKRNHLGKFGGKVNEGFFVGYSLNSNALRVFNSRTRIVEENLHIRFHNSTLNVVGTQSNGFAGTKASDNADPKSSYDDGSKPSSDDGKKVDEDPRKESECNDNEKEDNVNSTNNVNTAGNVNTVSSTVNAAGTNEVNAVGGKISIELPFDLKMHALEDDRIFDFSSDDEDDGAVADMNNLDTTIQISHIPTTRIHKDHPLDQVIRDLQSVTQTRNMSKNLEEHGFEKKDERGVVIRNKERLVAQRNTQEEGIDYDEGFTPVGRIKAIKKIEEEVYVCQPPGFEYLDFLNKVYMVEKALCELHEAPRAWLIEVKTASTPMETQKLLLKDEDGEEVDVHMYRSMIGSLMYLSSSRPEIMFAVCAFARYQVIPKVSHLHAVKRIFRYLKGQPKLGLWYPKDSPFDLVAYTDSDYAGANLDRKSTT